MHDVIIIGAGISGISLGLKLVRQRLSFVILEKASEVGGTWRDNLYPGCACDVESVLYSIKDAPNPNWKRTYASQEELQLYLVQISHDKNLRKYIRFETTVVEARWDSTNLTWSVMTDNGHYEARALVSATGALHLPNIPEFKGLQLFKGEIIHTAQWPANVSLEGKRVAVIGTGASAVQVVPKIATQARALSVFQQTAHWVVPRGDRTVSRAKVNLLRFTPGLLWFARTWMYWRREVLALLTRGNKRFAKMATSAAMRHICRQVSDPIMIAALTPSYQIGCKRILLSDDYYPSLCRSNVTLVTEPIATIRTNGIRTISGQFHEVDIIVMATGFKTFRSMSELRIIGTNGIRLEQGLGDPMSAFYGISISGYPNFFIMLGPNTGLGHTSVIVMIEAQARYICNGLRILQQKKCRALDIKPEHQHNFRKEMERRLSGTVWQTGGCSSWYQDSKGQNVSMWPGFSYEYILRTRTFSISQYIQY